MIRRLHADAQGRSLDVEEALDVLLRDLRTSRDGA